MNDSHSLTSFKRVVRIGEMLPTSCRSVFFIPSWKARNKHNFTLFKYMPLCEYPFLGLDICIHVFHIQVVLPSILNVANLPIPYE